MLILKGARLVDGTGAAPLERGAVLVDGERIKEVAPRDRLPTDGAEVVDLPDCTLVPGLMDLHIHISTFDVADFPTRAAIDVARARYTPEARMLYVTKRLRKVVEAGFTTIRDTGGAPTTMMAALRDSFDAGILPGPRLVVPGLCVTTNSHLYGLATYGQSYHPIPAANSPWEFRALARRHFLEGADYLKTDASGGVGTEREAIFRRTITREELEAIVDEAHALNKPVACHCHTPDAIRMAVAVGVDTIEHSAYTDDDAIALLVAERKILVTTLTHRRTEAIEAHMRMGAHSSVIEKMKRVQEIYFETFRRYHKAGVRIACGTDAVHEPTAGRSALELGLYVMLGMSPLEAIKAATATAAEGIGRGGDLGTLQPGKLADIVAVQGNLLDNIRLLEDESNVKLVIKGGKILADRRKG